MRKPSRLFVISDLHLGGDNPHAMSQPRKLAEFVSGLPRKLAADEALDLVIAGDFIDFLSVPPWSDWTADPAEAIAKLNKVVGKAGDGEGFSPVFDALGAHVAAGHRLTVMLGNHDLELTLPPVQNAFLERLGASPHDVLFLLDGRAYRVGGALIEHGNRYDNANANDFTHLRALSSVLSRGETPGDEAKVTVSTGSQLVQRVVNPLKGRYPFVDLLQPAGVLLLYLIASFEPSLVRKHLTEIPLLLGAQKKAEANAEGKKPGATANVAGSVDEVNPALRAAFPDLDNAISSPAENVGFFDAVSGVWDSVFSDSIAELVQKNKPISPERLAKIRIALGDFVAQDRSFDRSGPDGPYANAAGRLLQLAGVETVVMGHTHLARHHGPAERATYINTGTWADVVIIRPELVASGSDEELAQFVVGLVKDQGTRTFVPTYADVRVNADGHVGAAALRDAVF